MNNITILANNPNWVNSNKTLIRELAINSDIFVLIKFKYFDLTSDLDLKKQNIYFRVNIINSILGVDDFYPQIISKLKSNTSLYLVPNIHSSGKQFPDVTKEGLDFTYIDLNPIIELLLSYKDKPIFDKIKNYLFINNNLDTNRLSTGFLVILDYYLKYPNSTITLLGFYRDKTVLKEGLRIAFSSHNFLNEKEILQTIIPELNFV